METGVWIDSRTAFIVSLAEDEIKTKTVRSEIEEHERFPGEGKTFGRFGEQYLNDESSKEKRYEHQVQNYLELVVKELDDATSIVIFGPSGMKTELEKMLKANDILSGKLEVVVSADSMTEKQKIAWVREYYDKAAPRKLF